MTDTQPPISRKALEAAFVAFGHVGSDAENQQIILKLMKAIGAYLQVEAERSPVRALIHQIELGNYTDQHGHVLTDNVCFIKAKEAVDG